MNEEDIKILEQYIKSSFRLTLPEDVLQAIENLITRNRGLEALKNSCPAIPTTGIECDLKKQLKELEEDYTSVYLKGVYDERDKWKSKIKEKIEELDKEYRKILCKEGMTADKFDKLNKLEIETEILQELLEE